MKNKNEPVGNGENLPSDSRLLLILASPKTRKKPAEPPAEKHEAKQTNTMRHFFLPGLRLLLLLSISTVFASCKDDLSDYQTTQEWIYHDMVNYYLFYQDVPDRSQLNFNLSAEDFLLSAASEKDQKNGTCFSHIERANTAARTASTRSALTSAPSFGFEAAIIRDQNNRYYFRVLYIQENSPASEAGLKRGDWIIAVDNKAIGEDGYDRYIAHPDQSHLFTLGSYDGRAFHPTEDLNMPVPRYIYENTLLKTQQIRIGNQNVAYILYNGFEKDEEAFSQFFSELCSGSGIDHIILDLRYNPGGYVNTAQSLCTYLAPAEAIGKPLFSMTYNDKVNRTQTYNLDKNLLKIPQSLSYNNLYIITSSNTASASEIVINCLRPYMQGRLFQVGTNTFGKNIAQTGLTDKTSPGLTLWLTTCYLSNSQGFSDYFNGGLPTDFYVKEDYTGTLGEFATEDDILCRPVFSHIETGSFSGSTAVFLERADPGLETVDCSIDHKLQAAFINPIPVESLTESSQEATENR